jgi:hypothetical protein
MRAPRVAKISIEKRRCECGFDCGECDSELQPCANNSCGRILVRSCKYHKCIECYHKGNKKAKK